MAKKIAISGIIANYEMESESNVTPATLSKSLEAANGEDLLITINSPGGSVFAGLEMFSLIRNYPGNTETRVVSMAASMGSILALAGNKKTAEKTASYMIHNASSIAWGDHRVMAKMSRELEAVSGHLSNIYTDRAGVDNTEVRAKMNEETWMYGEELSEFGFEMIEPEEPVDMATAKFQAHSRYNDFKANIKPEEFVDDLEKAAASIDTKKSRFTNKATKNTPAAAGTKVEEATNMASLKDFLAANSDAKAEYDADIKAHGEKLFAEGETAGKQVGKDEAKAVYAVAIPILSSAHYPEALKTRVTEKAQAGDIEAVNDFVAMYDMTAEGIATAAAIKEQGEETPAAGGEVKTEAQKSEEAFQARLDKKGRS